MAIYVFGEPGALLVKVGFTNNWKERERALGKQYGGEFLYYHSTASEIAERRAHRLLRARFGVEGEWFMCGATVAASAVRRVVRIQRRAVKRLRSKRKPLRFVRQMKRERAAQAGA